MSTRSIRLLAAALLLCSAAAWVTNGDANAGNDRGDPASLPSADPLQFRGASFRGVEFATKQSPATIEIASQEPLAMTARSRFEVHPSSPASTAGLTPANTALLSDATVQSFCQDFSPLLSNIGLEWIVLKAAEAPGYLLLGYGGMLVAVGMVRWVAGVAGKKGIGR